MLVPLLLAVAATSARAQVAGISASSVGLNINFDLDVYSSTLSNIVASVNEGPNRTCEDVIPVKKIYGVNVSLSAIYSLQGIKCRVVRKLAFNGTLVSAIA
ncbi:hypothetical protein FIBSPDRAFT_165084 [Athelia psychrophila]|uniref:Uncharacterized protein n=1 Tax=Athelia psychrophila TaxID=1759441 RepID=A0A166B7B7_9AGAM|nr:hypothetical protein FIBSPDRAFT_165084 [Fibularhizoctonia sp. CBS 109695]